MNLYNKEFTVCKKVIYFFPTIILVIDMPFYTEHNFVIEFRWLVFHMKLVFNTGK
jgi:hypothetical protein